MSVPFDGWPVDLPADLRALVEDLEQGVLMVIVRRRDGCGCRLGTVKRVHGTDLLCVQRRVLVYERGDRRTRPDPLADRLLTGDHRRARIQLQALRLDEPHVLVDVACQHGVQGAMIMFDTLQALVRDVAAGKTRRPATFLV